MMEMEEEFEQWFEDTFGEFAKNSEKRFCYVGYKHSIFKKDEELEALRGFANDAYLNRDSIYNGENICDYLKKHGLLDDQGYQTALLKGE